MKDNMKHIKTKKIFESDVYETKEDIRDICLELEDSGFKISHSDYTFGDDNIHRGNVIITKGQEGAADLSGFAETFKYSEVSEVVDRLEDYIGIEKVAICLKGGWTRILDLPTMNKTMTGIAIGFKYK